MSDRWVGTTLGDVAEIAIGRTPPRKDSRYWTEDLERPFCTIADLQPLTVPKREGVTALAEEAGKAKRFPQGSLLMSFKLTIGRVGFAGVDLFPNEAIARLNPVSGDIDVRFLALALDAQDLEAYAGRAVKGKTLTREAIKGIPLLVPPLLEQRRIVDLIASIDVAIGTMDTFGLKAEEALRAIARDRLHSADGDEIQLDDVAAVIMGQSPPGSEVNPDGVGEPLLNGPTEFRRWVVGPPRQWTTSGKRRARAGDILFCVRGATAGRINHAAYDAAIGRGLASVRASSEADTCIVKNALLTGQGKLLPQAGGTIFPNISSSELKSFGLTWPKEEERQKLGSLLMAMEESIRRMSAARELLQRLRTGVTHELLSGQSELPDSYDRFLEEAL